MKRFATILPAAVVPACCLAFVALQQPVRAAAQIEASLASRFLVRGEQAALEIRVRDGQPDSLPTPPSVPGVTIRANESLQFDARRVPGGRKLEYFFTFQVLSYEPGRHEVPPIELGVDGEILRTRPIPFEVISPSDLSWIDTRVGDNKVRIAAAFRTPLTNPYEGQTLPVELKLYAPADLRVEDWGIPEFERDGLAVWRFEPNRPPFCRATINGGSFTGVSYPSTLTPTRSGKVTLGPARLRLVTIEAILDTFGYRGVETPVHLTIPSLTLDARPLPSGAPEGFRGAIGRFTLAAEAPDTKLREGDPVAVNLTISGTGNLDNLTAPEPLAADGWKTYESTVNPRGDERRSDSGSITFRQFIRPLGPQDKIPPFRLVYFDPATAEYHTILTNPIPFVVLPSTNPPLANTPPPPAAVPVERMTDILGLLPAAGRARSHPAIPWSTAWQVIPALAAILLGVLAVRLRLVPRWRRSPLDTAKHRAFKLLERTPADRRSFFRAAGGFIERWLGDRAAGIPELAAVLTDRDRECYRPESAGEMLDARQRRAILRTIRRHALSLLVCAATWLAVCPHAHAQQATGPASAAYQEGHWAEAIGRWLGSAPYGELDPNTLYNIGNAWYRLGSPGQASLYYRRALARDPSHNAARQNLRFLERKFGAITVQRPDYQYALARVPLRVWQSLVWAAGWLVILGLLVFPATRSGARLRLAAVIAFVAAPVLAAVGGLAWRHYPDDAAFAPLAEQAVITAEHAVLYTDASRSSPEVIDAPPGSLCRILADRDRWLYVTFATRTCGWIPAGNVERIIPLTAPTPPDPAAKPKATPGST